MRKMQQTSILDYTVLLFLRTHLEILVNDLFRKKIENSDFTIKKTNIYILSLLVQLLTIFFLQFNKK